MFKRSLLVAKKEEEEIITLWRERPILWDLCHKDFKKVHLKEAAREEMGQILGKTGIEVKERLKVLNDCYVRARRRVALRGSLPPSSRDAYLLKHLKFLLPSKLLMESRANNEDKKSNTFTNTSCISKVADVESSSSEIEEAPATTDSKSFALNNKSSTENNLLNNKNKNNHLKACSSSTGTCKKRKVDEDEAMKMVADSFRLVVNKCMEDREEKKQEDYFAEYVASSLRTMEPRRKQWCMHEIQSLLFRANMEQFITTIPPATNGTNPACSTLTTDAASVM